MYKPWKPKSFLQFKIIMNVLGVLALSASFEYLHCMLWGYGHYQYFTLSPKGLIDFYPVVAVICIVITAK